MEFKNNARSTVADNPLVAGAIILNVAPGEGGNFPSLFPFLATIWDSSPYPGDDSEMEIVKCTGRTTDALTIVRAQEGTADVAHSNGEKVAMLITAGHLSTILSDLAAHEIDTSTHGVTTVTGISETQTLTNKTIDGDDNTLQDIALTSLKDVDEQSFTNLLENGDFESWNAGAAAAPDGWSLANGATIVREPTEVKMGVYSAKVTAAAASSQIRYTLTAEERNRYKNRKMSLGCWVYSSIANATKIAISESGGTTYSNKHSGGGSWEWLVVKRTISAAPTYLQIALYPDNNAGTGFAYFDSVILVEGSVCPAFSPKPLVDDGIMLQSNTPSAANDYGKAGQWCYDANYIYVCIATDTWKRSAITTW